MSSAALLPISSIDIGVAEFIVAGWRASVRSTRTSVWRSGIYAAWPRLPICSTSLVPLIRVLALPIIVSSASSISRPWGNGVSRLSIIIARPLSNIVSHLSIIVVPACRSIRLIRGTSLPVALVIVVVRAIVFHTLV